MQDTFDRLLSKPYCSGKLLRRCGARILMYWRVHFGSALRFSSHFTHCSRFGKKSNKQQLGDLAEKKACVFLQSKGLSLVDRNYHSSFGEIDLIMQDKSEIVFVEVRSRAYTTFGTAIESINKTKQQKVIKSAIAYLQKRKWLDNINYRFDVVGCSPTTIEWIKNAFSHE